VTGKELEMVRMAKATCSRPRIPVLVEPPVAIPPDTSVSWPERLEGMPGVRVTRDCPVCGLEFTDREVWAMHIQACPSWWINHE